MCVAETVEYLPVYNKPQPYAVMGYTEEVASSTEEAPQEVGSSSFQHTCVTGVRALGANVPRGNAIDLPIGATPAVGGVIKLKYGEGVEDYHLVRIQAILKNGFYVQEYNYNRKGQYNERFIPFDDPAIVGFWSE